MKSLLTVISLIFGLMQPAFAAPAGKAYVANFKDNTVSVIDTADGKVVATIPVVQGPHGMAITRDGRTVYVAGDGSSSLSVIDTATDKVVKTVEVGKTPNGLALTPDGKNPASDVAVVTTEPRDLKLPSGVTMRLAFIEGPDGVTSPSPRTRP